MTDREKIYKTEITEERVETVLNNRDKPIERLREMTDGLSEFVIESILTVRHEDWNKETGLATKHGESRNNFPNKRRWE